MEPAFREAAPLKVLLLTPRAMGVGGIAQHVRCLARRLSAAGHEVHLISSETLRTPRPRRLANPLYAAASAVKALGRSYEVVHGHNLPSAPALKAARGKAKILTIHGLYSKQITILHGRALGWAAQAAEKVVLRWADALTTVTMDAAEYYERLGFRVEHVPNAIELSEMPKEGEEERVSEPQVAYLGRLSKEKGVDLLVDAAARHGLKGLVVAGDGPLRPLVERAAEKGLLGFLGPLPRSRALRVLAGSDAAVLPSREEGVSTALLEAMALRVPVVATRVGGTVEVVRDEVEALLVEPEAGRVAEAVRRLLEDRKEASRLAENAYRRVVEEYSWDAVAPRYLRLYGRLLEGEA